MTKNSATKQHAKRALFSKEQIRLHVASFKKVTDHTQMLKLKSEV